VPTTHPASERGLTAEIGPNDDDADLKVPLGIIGEEDVLPRRRSWRGRSLWYVATVFFIITVNFFLPRAMPGDPISALADSSSTAYVSSEETRTALAEYYGLDQPLVVQYVRYLGDLLQGDLGTSTRYNTPVSDLILGRLPWTVLLAVTAIVLATTVGLLAGIHSGWRRGRPVDQGLLSLFLTTSNFSLILLGPMALILFAVKLDWFPLGGARDSFASLTPVGQLIDIAHHLLLPATALALQYAGLQYLIVRASMVSELGSDYLLVGRAKGLRERRLKYGYAARNALMPIVSVVAMQFGFAAAVSALPERIFAYPGLGLLLFQSIAARDYPTMQGCFVLISLITVTANLIADLAYMRLDPRTAR
jgi:peptide/nickel transport system permease protein